MCQQQPRLRRGDSRCFSAGFRLEEVVAYLREELGGARDPELVPEVCHHWLLRDRGDGAVVGVAELAFVHPYDRVPWIALLEIAADRQGRGFAREAGAHLEQLAADGGYRRIGLNVLTANPPALEFWQHLGYELQGRPRGSGQGQAWALHKQLPTSLEPWLLQARELRSTATAARLARQSTCGDGPNLRPGPRGAWA